MILAKKNHENMYCMALNLCPLSRFSYGFLHLSLIIILHKKLYRVLIFIIFNPYSVIIFQYGPVTEAERTKLEKLAKKV